MQQAHAFPAVSSGERSGVHVESPFPLLSDRYEIENLLGYGGMGVVYQGRQVELGRKVAIKVLLTNSKPTPAQIARFEREARVYRELTHPNTVRIYDIGQTGDGQPFIVMEYLEGICLDEYLHRRGSIDPDRVLIFARQVLKSLIEAHAHGIVHRDLKPGNLFLCEQIGEPDFLKVLDFGIASYRESHDSSITKTGNTLGTPHYMSPEQVRAEPVDARCDIYSLGVTLFEMATGQLPYEGDSPFQVALKHTDENPIVIPQWVLAHPIGPIIQRAVEKDKAKRFQSATQMLKQLDALDELVRSLESAPTDEIVAEQLAERASDSELEDVRDSERRVSRTTGGRPPERAKLSLMAAAVVLASVFFFSPWSDSALITDIPQPVDSAPVEGSTENMDFPILGDDLEAKPDGVEVETNIFSHPHDVSLEELFLASNAEPLDGLVEESARPTDTSHSAEERQRGEDNERETLATRRQQNIEDDRPEDETVDDDEDDERGTLVEHHQQQNPDADRFGFETEDDDEGPVSLRADTVIDMAVLDQTELEQENPEEQAGDGQDDGQSAQLPLAPIFR